MTPPPPIQSEHCAGGLRGCEGAPDEAEVLARSRDPGWEGFRSFRVSGLGSRV